jgi:hypothetical protein
MGTWFSSYANKQSIVVDKNRVHLHVIDTGCSLTVSLKFNFIACVCPRKMTWSYACRKSTLFMSLTKCF